MSIHPYTNVYFGDLQFINIGNRTDEELFEVVKTIRVFFDNIFEIEEYRKRRRFITDKEVSLPADDSVKGSIKNRFNIEFYAYLIGVKFKSIAKYLEDMSKLKGIDYYKRLDKLKIKYTGYHTSFRSGQPVILNESYLLTYEVNKIGELTVNFKIIDSEPVVLSAITLSNATKLYVLDTFDLNNANFIKNLVLQLTNMNPSTLDLICYTNNSKSLARSLSNRLSPLTPVINDYLKQDNEEKLMMFLTREFGKILLIGTEEILDFIENNRDTFTKSIMETGSLL